MRHQGNEFAACRQTAEIRDRDALVADLCGNVVDLLVRKLEKLVQQPELMHHLERRGMDRVAAEVAQEVLVLLQHDHVAPGAREQKAGHHAGRPAAHDAAAGRDGVVVNGLLSPMR